MNRSASKSTVREIPTAELPGVWAEYVRTRSEPLRNRLMEHYLPLVWSTAERVRKGMPSAVDVDDLASYGTFGLIRAIKRFEPERGLKFVTFASRRIYGAILDELRRLDWVPRNVRTRADVLERSADRVRVEQGREPTLAEALDELGLPPGERERVGRDSRITGMAIGGEAVDRLPKPGGWADDPGHESLRDVLLKHFSIRDALIVRLTVVDGLTLSEVGDALNIHSSRVVQLRQSMFKRIRSMYSEPDLRELVGTAA